MFAAEVLSAGSLQFAVGCRAVQLIRWLLQQQAMQVEVPDGVPDEGAEGAAEAPGCRLRLCSGVVLCSLGK